MDRKAKLSYILGVGMVFLATPWSNLAVHAGKSEARLSATRSIEEMEKEKIVPDAIDLLPKSVLSVEYGDIKVNLGEELTPTQVKDAPTKITWEGADSNKFYLLAMLDLDVPSRLTPIFREALHWLVGNIPGHDIAKGEVLAEYVGSGPPLGTGLHRYTFLVFEQPEKLTFDMSHITAADFKPRAKFSIRDFAKKYNVDPQPTAGNFYQAQFDESVAKHHAEMVKNVMAGNH